MDKGSCNGDHFPTNQSLPKIAPYPTEPAASEETWRLGRGAQWGDKKLYPFNDRKNSSHHDKSKWNSLLSRMGWSSLRKAESRLIMRWRKVQPEGTTLQACYRLPINQETRSVWIWSNFSWGRRAFNRRELSSMPRTVRRGKGPSNLSGWRGIPQSWNCWIQVSKFCCVSLSSRCGSLSTHCVALSNRCGCFWFYYESR